MISGIFKKLAKSKKMNQFLDYCVSKPENAARVLLFANIAKDLINCGFYVHQSLNNKDIPEEKRKFVGALDLANGFLMVTTQLLAGLWFTTKKTQNAITKKFFGHVNKAYESFIKTKKGANLIKDVDLLARLDRNIKTGKQFDLCKSGFTAISTVVVTTVLAKRVVVPFIATPLATWYKNKYMDKPGEGKNVPAVPKTPTTQNTAVGTPLPVNQTSNTVSGVRKYSVQSFNDYTRNGMTIN